MNRNGLIQNLAKVLSTRKEAKNAVDMVFSAMKGALNNGEKVTISGFGSFHSYVTKAKKARNPRTGQILGVSPKKKARFRQSKDLFY